MLKNFVFHTYLTNLLKFKTKTVGFLLYIGITHYLFKGSHARAMCNRRYTFLRHFPLLLSFGTRTFSFVKKRGGMGPTRFERATDGLRVRCSTRLSYRPIFFFEKMAQHNCCYHSNIQAHSISIIRSMFKNSLFSIIY